MLGWELSSQDYLEVPIEWGVVYRDVIVFFYAVLGGDEKHYFILKSPQYCVLIFCRYGSAYLHIYAIEKGIPIPQLGTGKCSFLTATYLLDKLDGLLTSSPLSLYLREKRNGGYFYDHPGLDGGERLVATFCDCPCLYRPKSGKMPAFRLAMALAFISFLLWPPLLRVAAFRKSTIYHWNLSVKKKGWQTYDVGWPNWQKTSLITSWW